MKIKKGDQIKILSGRDRGKTGAVLKIHIDANSLTVDGLNLHKKRVRPKKQGQKGEVVLVPRPIPVSRAGLICSACKETIRVAHRFEGDKKVRYCRKCNATLN